MADLEFKVAAASSDGIVINRHFGRAERFLIFEVKDDELKYLETRNTSPICSYQEHDDLKLEETINKLIDCKYVLVARIGIGAENALNSKGIEAYEIPGVITESIEQLIKHIKIKQLFE